MVPEIVMLEHKIVIFLYIKIYLILGTPFGTAAICFHRVLCKETLDNAGSVAEMSLEDD